MDWWPEGRFGCPKGRPPVRPQPEGGGLPRRGGGQAGRQAGRPAGRQAGWLAGRLAAAAGRQQGRLSARRLRAAPARDGRASRAATKVPCVRVPRLAHLVLPAVPAAGKWALQFWWCCGARLRSASGCAAARGCAKAAPPVVAARRLHWSAASGQRHWRQPLALSANVARRRGTYVQVF